MQRPARSNADLKHHIAEAFIGLQSVQILNVTATGQCRVAGVLMSWERSTFSSSANGMKGLLQKSPSALERI